jgi:hypothetical protein
VVNKFTVIPPLFIWPGFPFFFFFFLPLMD